MWRHLKIVITNVTSISCGKAVLNVVSEGSTEERKKHARHCDCCQVWLFAAGKLQMKSVSQPSDNEPWKAKTSATSRPPGPLPWEATPTSPPAWMTHEVSENYRCRWRADLVFCRRRRQARLRGPLGIGISRYNDVGGCSETPVLLLNISPFA